MIKKIIKKYIVCPISKIIDNTDYAIALMLSKKITGSRNDKIILMPADDLSGGFGEDIMVYSFLNHFKDRQVDLAVRRKFIKDYAMDCHQYTILNGFFVYIKLLLLLRKYDELHVIGADIMCGDYSKSALLRFRTLKIASNMGLHTNLTGISVVANMSLTDKKRFKDYAKQNVIKVRDVTSYNRLISFLPKNKVVLTTDIAFLCPTIDCNKLSFKDCYKWVNKKRRLGKHIAAFCPNTIQMKKCGRETYLDNMQYLLKILLDNDCAIIMLYHDLRKYALQTNDKEVASYLYEQMHNDGLYFVDDIDNGVQLKNYLSLCDFTFTGRMHFGISGYVAGKPMFGISYYGKFEGLQKMMGINPEYSLIEYNNILDKVSCITSFINDIKENTRKVLLNISEIQEKANKNF